MKQISDAAKAASILHHTWGVDGFHQAVKIFNTIDTTDADIIATLEKYQAGVWGAIDQMPIDAWWENVVSLALSIDAAYEWDTGTTRGGIKWVRTN